MGIFETGLGIGNLIANLYMNKQNLDYQRELNNNLSGSQMQAFQLNSQEAQNARDWNLQVDSTKYQRQVADMKAAGINPALAMTGNISTQAASNAMASGVQGNAVAPRNDIQGMNSMMSNLANLQLLESQKRNIDADTHKKLADTEKTQADKVYIEALTGMTDTQKNEIVSRIAKNYQDVNESESRTLVNAAQETLLRIDAATRNEINEANLSLTRANKELSLAEKLHKEADIKRLKAEIPVLQAQANELSQRAILEGCEAGYYDQQTLNAFEQLGLIKMDKETKQFEIDHQNGDRNWRIVNQVVGNVTSVANTALSFTPVRSISHTVGTIGGKFNDYKTFVKNSRFSR